MLKNIKIKKIKIKIKIIKKEEKKEALPGLAYKILNMDLYEYRSEHFLIQAQLIASFWYGQAR